LPRLDAALTLRAVGKAQPAAAGGNGVVAAASTPKRRVVVALGAGDGAAFSLSVTDAPSGGGSSAEQSATLLPALSSTAHGAVVSAHVQAFERRAVPQKDAPAFGMRVLLTFEDHTAAMTQNGEVIWRRSEALASVAQLEFTGVRPPSAKTVTASVSILLFTVTFHANLAHSLTCSP
jgi:hypothetical protein